MDVYRADRAASVTTLVDLVRSSGSLREAYWEMGDDTVAYRSRLYGDVVIRRREAAEIRQWPGGDIVILSADGQRSIMVPSTIPNFPEFRARLMLWRSIEPAPRDDLSLLGGPLTLTIVPLYMLLLTPSDPILAVVCNTVPWGMLAAVLQFGPALFPITRPNRLITWAARLLITILLAQFAAAVVR